MNASEKSTEVSKDESIEKSGEGNNVTTGTKEENPDTTAGAQNKIVKRFGGRHLIFRQKTGGWWIVPKPYILVSSFRGPIWVFYGAGQIWLTHKKVEQLKSWIVRKPRFASKTVTDILNQIKPQVANFVDYCNEHSIEGTLVIEKKVLEFHWTFGNAPLPKEKEKPDNALDLDTIFKELVDSYLMAKTTLGV